ncbi:hypothetical protein FOL47_000649 [Perkinsus chesapeaki]|uniref:Uncharacterized protein n=1 Tax=Perkinsus chesapeaki TaxID=330153 RepID=A0A7J6MN01_PERCH|nr:hypothetical protein FOL47_000649 [Perkinsus chesapeaki]
MSNPTTIKAAMKEASTEGRRERLMVIDLVTIDEFDDNDPNLQDFDIDEYMADEVNIMKAANWCCLVVPVSSKEEGDSLIGNTVRKHKALKGKRKRKEEKQAEKRKQRREAVKEDGRSDDDDEDSDWYE